MKHQMYRVIFLLVLFTAAAVMAGEFDVGPSDLTVSVSASARCGEIEIIGYCNTHCQKRTVSHIYSNVTEVINSNGCTYDLDAEYWISYTVTAVGSTSKDGTVYISGDSAVLDVNWNSVSSNSGASTDGMSFSHDKNVGGWGWWDGPLSFLRNFNVSKTKGYAWTTDTIGDYKAVVTGEGSAISARGGGGSLQGSAGIEGFTISLGGSISAPTIRTGHQYYNTKWVAGKNIKIFTFIDEDDFTVGTETVDLSYSP